MTSSLHPIDSGFIGGPTTWQQPETVSLVGAMTSAPDETRVKVIDDLIRDLKRQEIWRQLDVLYVMAAHDAQAAGLNWKTAATALTPVNSPTFTTDRGYQGDGATSYLTSSYNPSTFGGVMSLNSAVWGVYDLSGPTAGSMIDFLSGTSRVQSNAANTAVQARVNSGSPIQALYSTIGTRDGHFVVRRQTSTGQELWHNGVQVSSDSVASTVLSNAVTALLASASGGQPSDAEIAVMWAGSSTVDVAKMHTALTTYLSAVGAI